MKKKLLFKYICLYLPFIVGSVMYSVGNISVFSSLLFFCGGYVAIKNTFDYRRVKKNIDSFNLECHDSSKKTYTNRNPENIIGLKRTRRYSKVRRRIKY